MCLGERRWAARPLSALGALIGRHDGRGDTDAREDEASEEGALSEHLVPDRLRAVRGRRVDRPHRRRRDTSAPAIGLGTVFLAACVAMFISGLVDRQHAIKRQQRAVT